MVPGESPAFSTGVLGALPASVVVVDRFGKIAFANRQVRDLLGYAAGELVGQSVEKLVPERLRGVHARLCGQWCQVSRRHIRESTSAGRLRERLLRRRNVSQ